MPFSMADINWLYTVLLFSATLIAAESVVLFAAPSSPARAFGESSLPRSAWWCWAGCPLFLIAATVRSVLRYWYGVRNQPDEDADARTDEQQVLPLTLHPPPCTHPIGSTGPRVWHARAGGTRRSHSLPVLGRTRCEALDSRGFRAATRMLASRPDRSDPEGRAGQSQPLAEWRPSRREAARLGGAASVLVPVQKSNKGPVDPCVVGIHSCMHSHICTLTHTHAGTGAQGSSGSRQGRPRCQDVCRHVFGRFHSRASG